MAWPVRPTTKPNLELRSLAVSYRRDLDVLGVSGDCGNAIGPGRGSGCTGRSAGCRHDARALGEVKECSTPYSLEPESACYSTAYARTSLAAGGSRILHLVSSLRLILIS